MRALMTVGSAQSRVRLLASSAGRWVEVAAATADSQGTATFVYRPKFSMEFRVDNPATGLVTPTMILVAVPEEVIVKPTSTAVKPGKRAVLRVTVGSADVGARIVRLQSLKGKRWVPVSSARTSVSGVATFRPRVTRPITFRVQLERADGGLTLSRTITVTPRR